MKQKFAKLMYGRYGLDELSKFLSTVSLVVMFVSMLLPSAARSIGFIAAIIILVNAYYRIFSKSFEKRRAENARFLRWRQPVLDRLRLRREMWKQRKEYKFFKCPSCKAVLRVPKGKGKIRVVCKKCGTAFEKKT
ncbi:MAG: hypothetical protein VB064_12545 [Oscillospiraceae bacterium]|nr:hypothetical protein [Oscillospiraceae bacterium]